jgi:hypothetical protein
MSKLTDERDDHVWATLDAHGQRTARGLSTMCNLSVTQTHQALARLKAAGQVRHGDPRVSPYLWTAVGADDDAVGTVEITVSDARFVVYMLEAMLAADRAGEPTEQVFKRIETALRRAGE